MADSNLQGLTIDKSVATTAPRHRRRQRWLWSGAAFVLLAALGGWVFTRPVTVETVTVSLLHPSQTFTLLNASGYVVAQRKAAVAAQSTGRLDWLGVEEGSKIKTGQILARLENRETAAALDQARANLAAIRAAREEAEAERHDAERADQRMRELLAQGFVAQSEADTAATRLARAQATVTAAQANIGVAEAALRGAQIAFDNTFIRAPFDAVVLTKAADLGDIVTPLGAAVNSKSAVVTIADLASLQVEADVSEANLNQIHPGQPCEIILDAIPGTRFRGELLTIVPTADRSKATVMVKVRFAQLDPRILPEMSARVAILSRAVTPAEERAITAIPPATVRNREGRTVVYRLESDRARVVPVVLGAAIGDQVEVRSGVAAGDKLVLRPLEQLRDGRRVVQAAP